MSRENRAWRLIDADGQVLGRMATGIAMALRGKYSSSFRPHEDAGEVVVVINTDKVRITGKKREQKTYYHYSGYPGGMREVNMGDLMEKDSCEVVRRAVYGMLPKNKLRDRMITRLKLYKGAEHPHVANVGGEKK